MLVKLPHLRNTYDIDLSIPSKFCYFRPSDRVISMECSALNFLCQCTQQKLQSICAVLTFDHQLKKILTFSVKDRYQLNYCICIKDFNAETNRFLHTFLGKTGWSSTSDRNVMSFREWSAAKRARRHNNFYHEWKITRALTTTHVSTYFFRKSTTFTIANS